MLAQIDALQGELGRYAGGLAGQVRVFANTAAVTEFLPEALGPYLAAHPNIDIDLEERSSPEIVQSVAAGFADLGIVSDAVDRAALETLPFRPDHLVLVVPRGHRLARRGSAALRDVASEAFIGLGTGSALGEYLDRHAANLGRQAALPGAAAQLRCDLRPCRRGRGHRDHAADGRAPSPPAHSQDAVAERSLGLTPIAALRARLRVLAPPAHRLVEVLRAH